MAAILRRREEYQPQVGSVFDGYDQVAAGVKETPTVQQDPGDQKKVTSTYPLLLQE